MTELLAGKNALVLGDGEVGDAIARGLARPGASVARHVAETPGAADLVVIPVTDPGGLTPAPLAEMDEAEWIRRCEVPLGSGAYGPAGSARAAVAAWWPDHPAGADDLHARRGRFGALQRGGRGRACAGQGRRGVGARRTSRSIA